MNTPDLTQILSRTETLLLDFDGPICGIFSALPAPVVAKRLSELITAHTPEPTPGLDSDDPLAVLSGAAHLGDTGFLASLERELTRSEVEAAQLAQPTPFAPEAIEAAARAGRRIAIVSNNSAKAIRAFLERHALDPFISDVFGRPFAAPDLMKPNPHSVLAALTALDVDASKSVLVGDSVSDTEVAKAVGTYAVGFANRPTKTTTLAVAGADIVIGDMARLAEAYGELTSA